MKVVVSLRPVTSLAAFALVLAGLTALSTASGDAAAKSSCGNTRAYYRDHHTRQYVEASSIRARRVGCRHARYVAHKWSRHSRLSGDPAGHGADFRCHYKRIGSDVGTTPCRKGSAHVRFDAYDSSPFH